MKYQHIFIIIFSFLLIGCEKIFHEPKISIASIKTQEQLIEAAEGCWAQFIWALNYPDHLGFYYQNLKGDDLAYGTAYYGRIYEPNPPLGGLCFGVDYPRRTKYFTYTGYLYESFYRVIASTNNLITQFRNISGEDKPTQEIMGEMFLLRAYCHFRLTRTYGQIPVIKDIEVDYNLSKPSYTQIYEFIESDLQVALTLLPEATDNARIPGKRPGKKAAKALLAEVYLHWAGYPIKNTEKYSLAAKEAGELIENSDYYGAELLPDFTYLWDADHTLNKESLFTLYFVEPGKVNSMDQINLMYSQTAANLYSRSFILFPSYYDWNNSIGYSGRIEPTFFASELSFFHRYPSGYRKNITFFNEIYVPEENYFEYQADTGYIYLDTLSICERPGYRKFYYEESLHAGAHDFSFIDTGNFINYNEIYIGATKIYLYRFAHTLLTYAEAKARSGQLDASAYEAVNRIRRRAHDVDQFSPSIYDLTPGLSPEVFADSVVWERAWELAGEPEGRYFDLLRLEKLEDLYLYRHYQEQSPPWKTITRDEYFLPIPEHDIILSPGLGE